MNYTDRFTLEAFNANAGALVKLWEANITENTVYVDIPISAFLLSEHMLAVLAVDTPRAEGYNNDMVSYILLANELHQVGNYKMYYNGSSTGSNAGTLGSTAGSSLHVFKRTAADDRLHCTTYYFAINHCPQVEAITCVAVTASEVEKIRVTTYEGYPFPPGSRMVLYGLKA